VCRDCIIERLFTAHHSGPVTPSVTPATPIEKDKSSMCHVAEECKVDNSSNDAYGRGHNHNEDDNSDSDDERLHHAAASNYDHNYYEDEQVADEEQDEEEDYQAQELEALTNEIEEPQIVGERLNHIQVKIPLNTLQSCIEWD
jgi:hypothetical protein